MLCQLGDGLGRRALDIADHDGLHAKTSSASGNSR
jgi:hypothetical protein